MSDDEVPSDSYDSDASESMFDGNDSDDEFTPNKEKGKEKLQGVEFQSFSSAQLQRSINDEIAGVANLIGIDSPIATILLQHFRWNRDALIDKLMDDRYVALKSAGEPEEFADSTRPLKRARLDTSTDFMCAICCDTEPEGIFQLRCMHMFCQGCWETYATAKIKEEGQCFFYCMQDGCRTVIDEPSVQKLTSGPVYERYCELVRQSYVAAHPKLKFCPHPSCSETVSCPGAVGSALFTEVPTVQCGEGHVFCAGCGLDSDHRPLICKFVATWLKNAREDAGTSQWIKANTRTCPKCNNNIEKAGGCNRILCRHCKYQFCWLCMKNWDVHGYNNDVCNTWKEPEPDDETQAAKQNLEKWLFYFDRFNNHEISARLDQQLVEQTEEKMLEIQESSELTWIEAKFMQDAVDELTKCRLTLKWSYAMAYFLSAGNQKQIFEDIQADLEKAVEDLSQLLEEPIERATVKRLRQRMLDKTVYVRTRHDVLLQDTAEGLAEGRWEWITPLE